MSDETARYRVVASGAIQEDVKQFAALAQERGFLNHFLNSARWIEEELHRTPRELGESREVLPDLGFELRITFAGPLQVEFAIHEPTKTVFYRRIRLRIR